MLACAIDRVVMSGTANADYLELDALVQQLSGLVRGLPDADAAAEILADLPDEIAARSGLLRDVVERGLTAEAQSPVFLETLIRVFEVEEGSDAELRERCDRVLARELRIGRRADAARAAAVAPLLARLHACRPQLVFARLFLARAEHLSGRHDAADALLAGITGAAAENPNVLTLRGLCARATGRGETAASFFTRSLEVKPDQRDVRELLSRDRLKIARKASADDRARFAVARGALSATTAAIGAVIASPVRAARGAWGGRAPLARAGARGVRLSAGIVLVLAVLTTPSGSGDAESLRQAQTPDIVAETTLVEQDEPDAPTFSPLTPKDPDGPDPEPLAAATARMQKAEEALHRFKAQHPGVDPALELVIGGSVLEELVHRSLELERDLAALEAESETIDKIESRYKGMRLAQRTVSTNSLRDTERAILTFLLAERDDLGTKFVKSNPFVRRLDERIAALRKRLAERPATTETQRVEVADSVGNLLRERKALVEVERARANAETRAVRSQIGDTRTRIAELRELEAIRSELDLELRNARTAFRAAGGSDLPGGPSQ